MAGLFRLSRKFHETIGDDLAEEIEAGFERVDALNDAAFRELFAARLDQRFAEFKADLDRQLAEFKAVIDRQLNEFKAEMRQEMTDLKAELRQEMAAMKLELKQEIGELRVSIASMEGRLLRWTFLFWLGTIGIVLAQRF